MKNPIVGLKEFRENTEKYISRVGKGESFMVVRKSKPVFKISSAEDEDVWESIIDFTALKKGGVEITEILSRL